MIIALPSSDGKTIEGHFGRARLFVVFETDNGAIVKKEIRHKLFGHHHDEDCHSHSGSAGSGHHSHSHAEVIRTLQNVDLVIAGGLGRKMYEDLLSAGIVVLVTGETGCEDAVNSFLKGTLTQRPTGVCGCGH